eukprot:IDg12281t1
MFRKRAEPHTEFPGCWQGRRRKSSSYGSVNYIIQHRSLDKGALRVRGREIAVGRRKSSGTCFCGTGVRMRGSGDFSHMKR